MVAANVSTLLPGLKRPTQAANKMVKPTITQRRAVSEVILYRMQIEATGKADDSVMDKVETTRKSPLFE